jgi:hypothetical protein
MRTRHERIESMAGSLLASCWTSLTLIDKTVESVFDEAEAIIDLSDSRLPAFTEEDQRVLDFLEGRSAPDRDKSLRLLARAAEIIRGGVA